MAGPHAAACAFAVLVAAAPAVGSASLLAPVSESRATRGALDSRKAARLRLDAGALAALRGSTTAVLRRFPLGAGRRSTLELRRHYPFTASARLVTVGTTGPEVLAPPDRAWFLGHVRGEPDSRVLLVAAPDHVYGFVLTRGDLVRFGPDAGGLHRLDRHAADDPWLSRSPGDFCLHDVHGAFLAAMRPAAASAPPAAGSRAGILLEMDLAIDTDLELRAKFGTAAAALEYIGSLVAAASLVYERDAGVRLRASYVRLWSGSDPWEEPSPVGTLLEVQRYWTDPARGMDGLAGPRDAVHFLSGKGPVGGVAWIGSVCQPRWAFAVSQVTGGFDVTDPRRIWDVLVFAHELGHVLGSPHTHCYNPPIDRCYGSEAGCYTGPPEPSSNGTIMSYCHLLPGGLANVSLRFGARPSDVVRGTAEYASCLAPAADSDPVCGNGVREDPETCDDGNTADGDGCSATCGREPRCGDRIRDVDETCDDGNTADGDGCSATCRREPRCGDGVVDEAESCDDGNASDGDGCSAFCTLEPCAVLVPHQTAWAPARFSWQRTTGDARLRLHARFGIPAHGEPAEEPSAVTVLARSGSGAEAFRLALPSGPTWRTDGRERRWQGAAPGGTVALRVRERGTSGELRHIEIRLTARGAWSLGPTDLPLAMTVLLGDESAGRAGRCGRYTFAPGACRAHGTRRLRCR